jgi:hypothetical protein
MYSHRIGQDRVDVVDLDPYGTAAPFIDAAVQCVKDDGKHGIYKLSRTDALSRPIMCYMYGSFGPRKWKLSRKMVSKQQQYLYKIIDVCIVFQTMEVFLSGENTVTNQ